MKLSSPTLSVDALANPELLREVLGRLPNRENPYAVLAMDSGTYMQFLWTPEGFILEYQGGSIDRHYCSKDYLLSEVVESALIQYLNGESVWCSDIGFYRKNIRGFWGVRLPVGVFYQLNHTRFQGCEVSA